MPGGVWGEEKDGDGQGRSTKELRAAQSVAVPCCAASASSPWLCPRPGCGERSRQEAVEAADRPAPHRCCRGFTHHHRAGGVVQQVQVWTDRQQDDGHSVLGQHSPAGRRLLQTCRDQRQDPVPGRARSSGGGDAPGTSGILRSFRSSMLVVNEKR